MVSRNYKIVLGDTSLLSKPEQRLFLEYLHDADVISLRIDNQVLAELSKTEHSNITDLKNSNSGFSQYRTKKKALKRINSFATKHLSRDDTDRHFNHETNPYKLGDYLNDLDEHIDTK
ncbi:MAG: hypothetical protein QM632_00775 [Micrococcaceae bacterium]